MLLVWQTRHRLVMQMMLISLVERANECWAQHGKRPTFIAVDWWHEGDVVEAAERINLQDEAV
jgi:hypothetical protein